MVVTRLLPVLTQQSATCMCLVRSGAWHALMQGFASQAEPIRALAGPTARALARTLIVAASGLNNVREGQEYISQLLQPIIGEVSHICAPLKGHLIQSITKNARSPAWCQMLLMRKAEKPLESQDIRAQAWHLGLLQRRRGAWLPAGTWRLWRSVERS